MLLTLVFVRVLCRRKDCATEYLRQGKSIVNDIFSFVLLTYCLALKID